MNFDLKIELLEYWLNNFKEVKKVPIHLNDKINPTKALVLFDSIEKSGEGIGEHKRIRPSDISLHIERMINLQKIKLEIESIKLTSKESRKI